MEKLISYPKVVFFGDSLTEYSFEPNDGPWACAIANKLQRICDVVTRGFCGYNSKQCLKILPKLFDTTNSHDIAAFFILLGANDCALSSSNQHVPLTDFQHCLKSMVEYLVSIGIDKDKIVLITCPPQDVSKIEKCNAEMAISRSGESARKYAQACLNLGQLIGVETIDVFRSFEETNNLSDLLNDGLHFSRKGSMLLAEIIWPYVEKRTKSINFKFPLWRDFDFNSV